ncbi:MAG: WG repeat-containing protein, partial [Bacteroidota bacterium]
MNLRNFHRLFLIGLILSLPRIASAQGFWLFEVAQNGKKGMIDRNANIIIPIEYDFVEEQFGRMVRVGTEAGVGMLTDSGEVIVEPRFDEVRFRRDSVLLIRKGNLWGYYDLVNEQFVEPKFRGIGRFVGGVAPLSLP